MRNVTTALDTAIQGLETKLSALRAARAALGGHATSPTAGRRRGPRRFTAAQRAEISRRMKARWAKFRAEKGSAKK